MWYLYVAQGWCSIPLLPVALLQEPSAAAGSFLLQHLLLAGVLIWHASFPVHHLPVIAAAIGWQLRSILPQFSVWPACGSTYALAAVL